MSPKTGEPCLRLPTTVLRHEGSEYQPVRPTLVVEAEAEATVMISIARLRPRIHRFRTDLTPADLSEETKRLARTRFDLGNDD